MLEVVLQHETAFAKLPDQDGLIQIYPPTEEERVAAKGWMGEVVAHIGSSPVEALVAA